MGSLALIVQTSPVSAAHRSTSALSYVLSVVAESVLSWFPVVVVGGVLRVDCRSVFSPLLSCCATGVFVLCVSDPGPERCVKKSMSTTKRNAIVPKNNVYLRAVVFECVCLLFMVWVIVYLY